jgi:hypothetical protein
MYYRYVAIALALFAGSTSYGPSAMAQTAAGPSTPAARLDGVWEGRGTPESRAYRGYGFSAEPPPMTDWAKARFAQAKPTFGPTSYSVAETNDPVYQCYPPGTPRIYFHPFPMEIIQLPDRVLMIFEYDHLIRQIWTDGRGHRDDLSPSWMGDAIGHWEGDTLVVETTNFNDKTWIDRRGVPHSEQLKLTERMRRLDEDRLQIDMLIEDPIAYTEPWTAQRLFGKVAWNIEEFMCMDNVTFLPFEKKVLGVQDGGAAPGPVSQGGEY